MTNIINEINLENGSNYKLRILEKYKTNETLKKLLKMTYDRVDFTYGITMKNIDYKPQSGRPISLETALEVLETKLATREVTGNAAIALLSQTLSNLSEDNAILIEKVIKRDLRINLGRTQINKIWKNLIIKPVYMRCDVYNEKTSKNIKFPAILQLKSDGTYREFQVQDGEVKCSSRSGESYDYPNLTIALQDYPDGVYTGELTVSGILDRAEGNGMINSLDIPYDKLHLELWDYITLDEYKQAAIKDKKNACKTPYQERFIKLLDIVPNKDEDQVKVIPYQYVASLGEALAKTSEYMNEGFEGAVLKDLKGVFKEGTSKHQLKLKLKIDLEVRCTGFQEGTVGTKREATFGALIFENDEGTIKGRCSGFTDEQLLDFNSRREELIGKVFTVQFNDLTTSVNNNYYALNHPRFICFREDKDDTNTLEEAFELRLMATSLGN